MLLLSGDLIFLETTNKRIALALTKVFFLSFLICRDENEFFEIKLISVNRQEAFQQHLESDKCLFCLDA